jgi:hypothetical protein
MDGSGHERTRRGVVVLLLLGCCACTAARTEAPKLQEFKTVGIISAVGDTLTVTEAGLTGPGNGKKAYSIESWGIDDLIVSRAGAILSRRYQVRPVIYKRAAFAALERKNPLVIVDLLRKDKIKELVRSEAALQGLDAYVVITKGTSIYGNGARSVEGIGIIHNSALLGSYNQVHALYVVRVFDGRTFTMLDQWSASPLDSTEIVRLRGPSRTVDDTLLPAGMQPAENEKLKAAVTDLIERSLPATLETLRLVDPS